MNVHDLPTEERDEVFHRSWVKSLIDTGHKELAAMVIDGFLNIYYDEWTVDIIVNLPADSLEYLSHDKAAWDIAQRLLRKLCAKQFSNMDNAFIGDENIEISTRIALISVEPNWRDVTRDLITKSKDLNQGIVTDLAMRRRGKAPILYNEMKFASNSEVRVAQELERRGILFFPLPLAVRGDTGNRYQDHREVDFLICYLGKWGILEVAFHLGRYEKDQEKAQWFKDAGISCIEFASSERAYNNPSDVVNTFLKNLALHK